jgi:hypothetical protein
MSECQVIMEAPYGWVAVEGEAHSAYRRPGLERKSVGGVEPRPEGPKELCSLGPLGRRAVPGHLRLEFPSSVEGPRPVRKPAAKRAGLNDGDAGG